MIPVRHPPWMLDAACSDMDTDLFFPVRGENTEPAKEICRTCLVQVECLEYALARNEKFGIWGGACQRERARIRKRRQLEAA